MSRDPHRDHHLHIVRRYFDDIWNRGDLAAVEALMAPELAGHVNGRTFHGRETLKQRPELWVNADDLGELEQLGLVTVPGAPG